MTKKTNNKKQDRITISAQINNELLIKLEEYAKKDQRSKSFIINKALIKFLEENK